MPTKLLVPRTATLKTEGELPDSRLLSEWRHLDAYVLLGEPGSGKSTAFQEEALAMGSAAMFRTARQLLTIGPPDGWRDEVLFIDALDERRSASISSVTALDALRQKLNDLGRPKFRLSCREADWIASGITDLEEVAPSKKVEALWLDSLSNGNIETLLQNWSPARVPDPVRFLDRAAQQKLTPLLANPLLLELLVDAVRGNAWPDSRQGTYGLACRHMALEHNEAHRLADAGRSPPLNQLLQTAGIICALMLFSDTQYITLDPADSGAGILCVDDLPAALGAQSNAVSVVLRSKLFVADGVLRAPRHRTIAEYLAAKSVARLISEDGLPITRVLALMSGIDGRIVDPLRGLYAWLALHSLEEQELLIERDPLALVLYGDVRPFSSGNKAKVLQALLGEGERFRRFRNENWESHPFGALGTRDMQQTFAELLHSSSREPAHQVLLDCIFDAIRYGDDFPDLSKSLERIVRDQSYWEEVRNSALDALLSRPQFSAETAKGLLDDIRKEMVADENEELAGRLLIALYPSHLSAVEALEHLRAPRRQSFVGNLRMFWAYYFLDSTQSQDTPVVLDRLIDILASRGSTTDEDREGLDYDEVRELASKTLVRALGEAGSQLPPQRLYRWLGVGINKYGSQELDGEAAESVRDWLSKRPATMKDVFAYGVKQVAPDVRDGRRYFWVVEERLFRTPLPRDWYQWLLHQGVDADDSDFAKFCLQRAAHAALNPSDTFDIHLEDVEAWVERQAERWPAADQWKTEVTAWPLDAYQGKEFERQKTREVRHAVERNERQRQIAPELAKIYSGQANPRLHDQLVGAYRKRFYDIEGETPLERIQDFLAVGPSEADHAIAGMTAVLSRSDLPTADEIQKSQTEGKSFYMSSACLLAAELVHEKDPSAWSLWSDTLLSTMLAFCFTGAAGSMPPWYYQAAESRPETVALLLLKFGLPEVSSKSDPLLRPLYDFRDDKAPKTLARLILPEIFRAIPPKPTNGQLRFLNTVIIPGCRLHLNREDVRALIETRLLTDESDLALKISLHVAGIPFDTVKHCSAIDHLYKVYPESANYVSEGLDQQGFDVETFANSSSSLGLIIEILARSSMPEIITDSSDYTHGHRRREIVYRLTRMLAADPALAAGEALRRLRAIPELEPWAVHFDGCYFDQERIARMANFEPPSVEAVAQVLANASPANARDMAELIREHLIVIAQKIQFEETNSLELFYQPTGKKTNRPKAENDCRNVLHDLLRDRLLKKDVQIEKESYAAGDKRADLQGSAIAKTGRIVVPVEIKKDNHPEVWTAWRDQLERRYSASPYAEGIGIYLVLWFGHSTKAAPNGTKPKSAKHMAEMLSAVIPDDRRWHIVGLVIDLSRDLR